jgi:amino acid transporter
MSLVEDVRALSREQRLAGGASVALFVTMLLPWYDKSFFQRGQVVHDGLNAFQAFSWVEAAVLLVAASVLVLLYARSQRRGFHLPGGDGTAIMIAGGWSAALLVWRFFDKPGASGSNEVGVTVGLDWGIFIAFLAAVALAYAGYRVRSAHRPEPPLPAAVTEPQRPVRTPRTPRVERMPDRRPHTAPTEPLQDTDETQRLGEQLELGDPPRYEPPH